MINLPNILFWTTVCYLNVIRLRTKIAVLILTLIICCCITGVVFYFEDKTEGTVWTERTAGVSTTPIVPTWTGLTLRTGASTVQHQIKETTETNQSTFEPVLQKYTHHDARLVDFNHTDYNGDLLINNKSLGTYIFNLHSFKPGWNVEGYIEYFNDRKPYVTYFAKSTYIDAVFPPANTKLTSLQINDVRYSKIDELYDDPTRIPIGEIFPDEALVFLVEYFQIDFIHHDSPFNFKVRHRFLTFFQCNFRTRNSRSAWMLSNVCVLAPLYRKRMNYCKLTQPTSIIVLTKSTSLAICQPWKSSSLMQKSIFLCRR